jgi:hypothetical protein
VRAFAVSVAVRLHRQGTMHKNAFATFEHQTREPRGAWLCLLFRRVDASGFGMSAYVLDAGRDIRRERVLTRNRAKGSTFSMVVPLEVFELASDLWEPLDPAECAGRDVRFLRTDE